MQLSTEFLRRFLGAGGLHGLESDRNTWNIVGENIPKNPEVIILAIVILGPKSDLRLIVLNSLRIKPNRQCKKLKTVPIMAISFNTYQGYPKIPMRDSFK